MARYGGYIEIEVIVFAYKYMGKAASCERVALLLDDVGYRGKNGNKISRHVVFRALTQNAEGQELLAERRKRRIN